ncbi:bifunctional diaminohydroxyphosphoribosylaminopyrimidine deaminase/5-amino-6-(5-phosphoribosylamino)uracil reductase RibD [Ralstonia solanacearum]|uniref:bifunctional diaminohydroxyphosphoribosylaminopyrimidine deaminase/5-amino-6-(5-phosphoribosylamino)uracil reductase RibD n=1 Tax=Ralstonia solanacearum TaxID=305 RepID=UPI00360910E7
MMQRALALAENGLFTTTPNPRVGCVLVRDDTIIGEGFTQPPGQDHAEIQAIKDAQAHGHDVRGATAYVTLEPCSHFGRTPPCADRLVEAGIARVVAAMEDPNPAVSGRGLQRLREAGIDVPLRPAGTRGARTEHRLRLAHDARHAVGARQGGGIAGWPHRAGHGVSQWITETEARNDGHRWRARACAILTGIGTVREDNPRLTVRAIPTPRQPRRILIDSGLDVPLDAHILTADDHREPTLIFAARPEAGRMRALAEHGAEVILLPNADGKVDLPAMLRELGRREINELHVEAGYKLNGSLLREGLVDEILVYLAPKVLGSGQGMFNLGPLQSLEGAAEFFFHDITRVGGDLRILARRNPTD